MKPTSFLDFSVSVKLLYLNEPIKWILSQACECSYKNVIGRTVFNFPRYNKRKFSPTLHCICCIFNLYPYTYIGPPILRDDFFVRIEENTRNVPVDLALDPSPFPVNTLSFDWTRDGRPLTTVTGPALTYSSVTFSSVDRTDSGTYSVLTTNVVDGVQVGNDTGSFNLDVVCKSL